MRGTQIHQAQPRFAVHRPPRQGRAAGLVGGAILLLFAGAAAADEGQRPNSLLAAVRAAVTSGRVTNSRVIGFTLAKGFFQELPKPGAVLTGFDLGVGKFLDRDTIYALRAVYSTAGGESSGSEHGLFTDRVLAGQRLLKTKIQWTVRLRARQGYAVGGITLRTGLNLDGMSVKFMRIAGSWLDPQNAYTSDWVGNSSGGSERFVGRSGAPVVGLLGTEDEIYVMALGLFFADTTEVAGKRPGEPPPRNLPAEANGPRPAEPPEPPALPNAAPAEPKPAHASRSWLPLAAFGAVAAPVFLLLLVSCGRKKKPELAAQDGAKDQANARPSVAPPVPSSACTAICEKPPGGADRWPPPLDEVLFELPETDPHETSCVPKLADPPPLAVTSPIATTAICEPTTSRTKTAEKTPAMP